MQNLSNKGIEGQSNITAKDLYRYPAIPTSKIQFIGWKKKRFNL